MADRLQNAFSDADRQNIRTAYAALMDRASDYFEEIRLSLALQGVPEKEREAGLTPLSRQEIVFRLAELVNLAQEVMPDRTKGLAEFMAVSGATSSEEKGRVAAVVNQVTAVMAKQRITLPEVINAQLPYTDLGGRPTALPVLHL